MKTQTLLLVYQQINIGMTALELNELKSLVKLNYPNGNINPFIPSNKHGNDSTMLNLNSVCL